MVITTGPKKIDSHIQMPKLMLKRFEGPNHKLFYYDVKKRIIGSNGHAKSINTERDYFSEEIEQYLHDNIEDPFSVFLQFVDKFDFSGNISDEFLPYENKVKRFMYSLFTRSPNFSSEVAKHSVIWPLLKKQEQHNVAAKYGLAFLENWKLFDDFYLSFIHNTTTEPFVLPICGVYSFMFRESRYVVLPVSPKLAVALIGNEALKQNENNKLLHYTDEKAVIEHFNYQAFRTQCREENGFVVSSNKSSLIQLYEKYLANNK